MECDSINRPVDTWLRTVALGEQLEATPRALEADVKGGGLFATSNETKLREFRIRVNGR